VFGMALPVSLGASGLSPFEEFEEFEEFEVIEGLTYADGSVGCCAMIGCDSGYFPDCLDDETVGQVYPMPDRCPRWSTRRMSLHPTGSASRRPQTCSSWRRWYATLSASTGITTAPTRCWTRLRRLRALANGLYGSVFSCLMSEALQRSHDRLLISAFGNTEVTRRRRCSGSRTCCLRFRLTTSRAIRC
jgi:hypothetical protein